MQPTFVQTRGFIIQRQPTFVQSRGSKSALSSSAGPKAARSRAAGACSKAAHLGAVKGVSFPEAAHLCAVEGIKV